MGIVVATFTILCSDQSCNRTKEKKERQKRADRGACQASFKEKCQKEHQSAYQGQQKDRGPFYDLPGYHQWFY